MTPNQYVAADELERLYVKALQSAFEESLSCRGQRPDWFQSVLIRADLENSTQLEKPRITTYTSSVFALDFQACNKVLVFLESVRNEVLAFYSVSPENQALVKELCTKLLYYRNKYVGHNSANFEQEMEAEAVRTALEQMRKVLAVAFRTLQMPNGRSYYQEFNSKLYRYLQLHTLEKYYISDYLDGTRYDLRKFSDSCGILGLEDGVEDGRHFFLSADFATDLNRLKNMMIRSKDYMPSPDAEQKPRPTQVFQPIQQSRPAQVFQPTYQPQPIQTVRSTQQPQPAQVFQPPRQPQPAQAVRSAPYVAQASASPMPSKEMPGALVVFMAVLSVLLFSGIAVGIYALLS